VIEPEEQGIFWHQHGIRACAKHFQWRSGAESSLILSTNRHNNSDRD